ncbi:hypothetical protein F2Q69_00007573 [Brassica cretica]|uniref:Aspartic peptidase DDI1-type domain-containing protein n=1 Tax=Brassica cretica TaxID=69181 RepID=A0A8S9NWV7_BRACR|nr:hypothetical protein F2Q69_00007573 [Brassica cretica]
MFFRETRETEEDIRRMFCEAREKMRITLKKKSDPGQFAIPCTVKGIELPHALCDTGASVSILPRVMADHLGLQVEPSQELFTFVDCSQRNSGGIMRDLEVQIGNSLVPVDFHILDIKMNWNSSLLLGRAFLSTGGSVCNLQTKQLCLTLIYPNAHYDPILDKNSTSIDTQPQQPNHFRVTTDKAYFPSIDTNVDATRDGDYSIGSWADNHYHESYAVETGYCDQGDDELNEGFTYEELLNMQKRDETDQNRAATAWERTCFSHPIDKESRPLIDTSHSQSIDINSTTLIDIRPIPKTTISEKDKFDNQYLTPDEFGIFRDPDGYARAIDGRTLHVSREDIANIFQTANGADNLCIHQRSIPEQQQKATKEINDTVGGMDKSFKQRTRHPTQPSIDVDVPTSVDRKPE